MLNGGRTGEDSNGRREDSTDDFVWNSGCSFFKGFADSREDDDLLDVSSVLLVDSHDVEKSFNVESSGFRRFDKN